MRELVKWMSRWEILFRFDFWDVVFMFLLVMVIWIGIFGYQLYRVWRRGNLLGDIEKWIYSPVGATYVRCFMYPLLPFFALAVLLVMPFVAAYYFLEWWLHRRQK